ncbi:MAG TPA: hypothetical protein VFP59_13360 [Candidatus Angelobacter sp.]|nr:hypothetical protein [Candidatus Angelobacter sp.]
MKSSVTLKTTVLLLALTFSASAFAANASKGNFQISEQVQVSGTTLPAGNYTAKWDGTGPAVQVSILRDGKTVATVPGKLIQSNQKAAYDSSEIQTGASGSRELTELHFSGKQYALELGNAQGKSAESMK